MSRDLPFEEMKVNPPPHEHKHQTVTIHAIRQRSGVPYEIERKMCPGCQRVLDEKPLRRAAA